ncbi:ice-binding family protein [Lacinutrix sp. Bg11-31]|uniref:ice-binding family protein n=1 Tax=Lacinutrix sp. Bg11-31 TaxID=2057808 RepID=UPI002100A9B3|nr:ice-binding family protein [Lacinutrix sp. Bg11-31]
MIQSITENSIISTTSTTDLLITGMTLSPASGTYLTFFNAQLVSSKTFSSEQGVTDASNLYNELMAYPGGVPHALAFGSGETLLPGVYDVAGAPSIAGILTLDGGGDPNSVFIIRGPGAFTTGVGTTVNLIGNAKAENIFWVSNAAMSTAANTMMKGTMLGGGTGAGAVSLGADSNLEGRLLTKLGAVTLGANVVITVPTGIAPVNLGVLASFAMWSSSGAVSDTATSTTTGDVGTALGTLTMTGTHIGEEYPAGTISSTSTTTYSIYKNGAEVLNSSRTHNVQISTVSLQEMVTVTAGDTIEIRWKVDAGEAILNHRVLSLIRSGNGSF